MEIDIDPETEQQIIELSQDLNIHRRIIRSVAPSIYGMEIIKEALATVLFGGVYRVTPDGMKQRGESNILLIGDPGVAKSQLLQYVKLLAPRGLLTSGKASSAAGLTAAVVRDAETGEFSLEAGALVLADQGVCLTADTEILLSSGKIYTIEEIVEKGIKEEVISFNPNSFILSSNKIINTSKRISDDIYKLKFSTGDVLKATKEHPLPTWDNGLVWKEVEELKPGDIIIDYRTYPFLETENKNENEYSLSEELAEFLGLIVTDGNLSKEKYKISFYSKSEELLKRYKFLVEQVFDLQTKNYVDKRSMITRLYFDNKQIHTFLNNLGVPNISKSKVPCILPNILDAPVKIIHAFLSGVINGDGSVSNRKSGGIIDVIVGNKETAIFYQKLFRKIGIVAQLNTSKQNGGGEVSIGEYTIYKVSITGVSNIRKFNPNKLMSHKKKAYQKIVKRQDKSDKVYKIEKIFQSLSSLIPHGNKSILYNRSIRKSQLKRMGLNKKIISSALEELSKYDTIKQSPEYNLLTKIISNDVHFIILKNKTKIESQTVYNLEIDNDNTFFGNFIPVHNCMIDEFDKMNPVDRSSIHEAMEQQVISIAKAGIVATLNARTAIIAAANPRFGRYEDSRPPADNINLPATILSRFDLIFVIRDEPNPEIDKKMARHILELRRGHVIESTEPVIPMDLLRKYISYSKQTLQPSLTDEALERIEEYYLGLRKESDSTAAIAITPRYLEAIIRLSESQARMALKEEVTIDHVEAAINLLRTSLEQVGKDPVTGRVDIDYLLSGTTKSSRSKLQILIDIIQEESRKGSSDMVAIGRIKELAKEQNIEDDFVDRAINQLRSNGEIFSPREGFVKLA
jgi:replicative DNA helicase Mcm